VSTPVVRTIPTESGAGDLREARRKPIPREGTAARRAQYQLPLRPPAHHTRFGVRTAAGGLVLEVHAAPPDALVFEHPAGGECCTIHEATYGLQPLMRISRRGQPAAWVRKVIFAPTREHYTVDLGPAELSVRGSPLDHEYTISHGRRTIATVSRVGPRAPDTYGVEVAPGQDDALILAVTVCITLMSGGASAPLPLHPPRAGGPATAGSGRRSS
jgi:uncharacterized protein YxjI